MIFVEKIRISVVVLCGYQRMKYARNCLLSRVVKDGRQRINRRLIEVIYCAYHCEGRGRIRDTQDRS